MLPMVRQFCVLLMVACNKGHNWQSGVHATFIITVIVLLHIKIIRNALSVFVSDLSCLVHNGDDLLGRLCTAGGRVR